MKIIRQKIVTQQHTTVSIGITELEHILRENVCKQLKIDHNANVSITWDDSSEGGLQAVELTFEHTSERNA